MTTSIVLRIPNSLLKHHDHLQGFFTAMIMKLDRNSHKATPTVNSLQEIMDKLIEEIVEFEKQVAEDKFNENSLIELADQANFAFLAYVALRLEGVVHEYQKSDPNLTGRGYKVVEESLREGVGQEAGTTHSKRSSDS